MPKAATTASKANDLSGDAYCMPVMKASPGEVIRVLSLGSDLKPAQFVALIKTDNLEILQLVVPSGQIVPTHELQGEVVVHCLQGRVSISALGAIHDLGPEQLLYYSQNEPFSILGIENASLLIMVARRRAGQDVTLIG
jgi:quercetin dioxygenase-like cupin family protein